MHLHEFWLSVSPSYDAMGPRLLGECAWLVLSLSVGKPSEMGWPDHDFGDAGSL